MARITEFHIECSTERHWGQMFDLPMATAIEASMVHRGLPDGLSDGYNDRNHDGVPEKTKDGTPTEFDLEC